MNRWPGNKGKTEARLLLEYLRTSNPVTRSVLRHILFIRGQESRNCFHKL